MNSSWGYCCLLYCLSPKQIALRLISLAGTKIGAFVYCSQSIHAQGVLGCLCDCFFHVNVVIGCDYFLLSGINILKKIVVVWGISAEMYPSWKSVLLYPIPPMCVCGPSDFLEFGVPGV